MVYLALPGENKPLVYLHFRFRLVHLGCRERDLKKEIKGKDKTTMNTNYYLEENLMKDRQNELLAQAQREALVRELKKAVVERGKARNRTKENKPKFNWFFGTKNRSASRMN